MGRGVEFRATVWCLALMPLFAQDKAVFEGKVIDSITAQAVPKAAIRLSPLDGGQPVYSGRSDSGGQFRFEAIAPGDYHLEASARGHTDTGAAVVQSGRSSSVLQFAPGQNVTGVSILLDAEAVIAGRVTCLEGEIPSGAMVTAVQPAWQNGIRIYTRAAANPVDDRGEYRLILPAGRYYILASYTARGGLFTDGPGEPELRIAPVYYPGAATVEAASPVDLRPGQQMSGIDFKLPLVKTYHVRGVIVPYVYSPGAKPLFLRRRDGDRLNGAGTNIEKDGSFDFAGVEPGSYWLDVLPVRGLPTAPLTSIDVADRDGNGFRVAGIPQFEIHGHTRFADENAAVSPSQVNFLLQQLDWNYLQFSPGFSSGSERAFLLRNMQSGRYALRIASEGDVYLKSVSLGGHPVEGAVLDLRSGPPGEMEIVLDTGTGEVTGAVHWPDPVAGAPRLEAARAILVSADGSTSNTLARSEGVGADGKFHFRWVPPGRWLGFVSPTFDEGLWQNANFVKEIADLGVAIDVDKRRAAHAEPTPLNPDDIQHAVERIKP